MSDDLMLSDEKDGVAEEQSNANGNANANANVAKPNSNTNDTDIKTDIKTETESTTEAESTPKKRVLVSGVYDTFNLSLIEFFERASKLGELHVRVSSDKSVKLHTGQSPAMNETDRLFVVRSIRHVFDAQLGSGSDSDSTMVDLNLVNVNPDVFYYHARENAHITESLQNACAARNIECRIPVAVARTDPMPMPMPMPVSMPMSAMVAAPEQSARSNNSNTAAAADPFADWKTCFPWRLCFAGGWLDQPWVSKHFPGSVIVINITFDEHFVRSCGLATSSRKTARKIWGKIASIPQSLSLIDLARMLFGAENPPGCKYVSGSQDHLGLMLPGINRLDYFGTFWPTHIECMQHNPKFPQICHWLQRVLWLVPLRPRQATFDPLTVKNINEATVEQLADASTKCWKALLSMDIVELGESLTETLYAYKRILPNTIPDDIEPICKKYIAESYGCLFSGAGGGGLLMVISERTVENGFQIEIVKNHKWRVNQENQ